MPIITPDDLEFELDHQLAWRLKEISAIHSFVRNATGFVAINAALRAGITTIYSHWEGYVKRSSELYLEFIFNQRLPLSEIRLEIVGYFLEPSFRSAGGQSKSFSAQKSLEFAESVSTRALRPRKDIRVSTKSNLRYEIFKEISGQLGLIDFIVNVDEHFINSKLCDKRNAVAHGSTVPISQDDFDDCRIVISDLIRSFKNRIVTAASNSEYKKTSVFAA
jgi:hypothetical protein